MLPQFRAGMTAFLDALPGSLEIALITTGGQIASASRPLPIAREAAQSDQLFCGSRGGNSFLDTLLKA